MTALALGLRSSIVAMCMCLPAHADSVFISGEAAWSPERLSCPPVCFGSDYLFRGEIGYSKPLPDGMRFEGGVGHISAPSNPHDNWGLNPVFIRLRKDFYF